MSALLEVQNVTMRFGGLTAVSRVDLTLRQGELVGLVGPNGAGKTTLIAVISGFLKPNEGSVLFNGQNITGLKPNRIARMGIVRTFQIVKPLDNLTVMDNVMVGAYANISFIDPKQAHECADAAMEITGLTPLAGRLAGHLTLASRKRLEIARAIAMQPKLLLLDEVFAGLTPSESDDAIAMIREIRKTGLTILMIEHVMKVTMALSERVVVLHFGEKIAEGIPEEVMRDEKTVQAYLGRAAHA